MRRPGSRPLDASFLYLEQPTHADARRRRWGSSAAPAGGFDYERLVELVEQRIGAGAALPAEGAPRPGDLARPVWVDDADFDVAYHVRRSALPQAGHRTTSSRSSSRRLMSRPLDHTPPALGDVPGRGAGRRPRRDASPRPTRRWSTASARSTSARCILDRDGPSRAQVPEELWMPRPEPTDARLVVGRGRARRSPGPAEIVDNVRVAAGDASATVGKVGGRGRHACSSMARTGGRPGARAPRSTSRSSTQRRFAIARTDLERYREVRAAHGVHRQRRRAHRRHRCAAHLAALPRRAGHRVVDACGRWCRCRCAARPTARARPAGLGNRVSSFLVDLPVGEPSPRVRLHHVAHAMREHTAGGRSVGADTLARIGGFAPPTLHALGARAASGHLEADLQPGGDERARTAVPALRGRRPDAGDVPGGAAGRRPGASRSGSPPTTAACTTGSTRDRDAMPTSTCSPDDGRRGVRRTPVHRAVGGRRLMRVYVPATWPMLRKLVVNDRL